MKIQIPSIYFPVTTLITGFIQLKVLAKLTHIYMQLILLKISYSVMNYCGLCEKISVVKPQL